MEDFPVHDTDYVPDCDVDMMIANDGGANCSDNCHIDHDPFLVDGVRDYQSTRRMNDDRDNVVDTKMFAVVHS